MKFRGLAGILFVGVVIASSSGAQAESEFSVFGGLQGAPHSNFTVDGTTMTTAWEGRSFEIPPYYGLRFAQWFDKNWGAAINFVHAKVYSSDESRSINGFEVMEFTDGINPLTAVLLYRFDQKFMGLQPYVGIGAGISIPHVELQEAIDDDLTFKYQYGGPVASFLAGAKYPITNNWALFAEYQFHYYWVSVDMEPNNTFESNIITNALNLGVSYKW